ncbi:hypothetical protein ACGFJT_36925 [Actinomadura geliboluensis]|uniref:hypothetical protein n=1 Tax=Actinomadura geliboluensis TaxID=882440 RepID=UPI00371BD567
MGQEFVYRSHCRELLGRRAEGQDTQPGTAAEAALAMCEVAKAIPLHGAVAGVYFRLFSDAFPEQAKGMFGDALIRVRDFERLFRQEMDDHERLIRHKIRQQWRTL